jgi:hypothetical protein
MIERVRFISRFRFDRYAFLVNLCNSNTGGVIEGVAKLYRAMGHVPSSCSTLRSNLPSATEAKTGKPCPQLARCTPGFLSRNERKIAFCECLTSYKTVQRGCTIGFINALNCLTGFREEIEKNGIATRKWFARCVKKSDLHLNMSPSGAESITTRNSRRRGLRRGAT